MSEQNSEMATTADLLSVVPAVLCGNPVVALSLRMTPLQPLHATNIALTAAQAYRLKQDLEFLFTHSITLSSLPLEEFDHSSPEVLPELPPQIPVQEQPANVPKKPSKKNPRKKN
jgi:hypothetical protein